jgi:RND family efflux transporter MFP subunit
MNSLQRLLSHSALILLAGSVLSARAQTPEAVVELASVSRGEAASVMRLPGTVISTRDATLSAEIAGRLTWVARVGERVAAGDAVALIDQHLLDLALRDNEAGIARLETDIAYNERQIERLARLAEKNNMARAELDEVQSRLEMLRQEREIAEVARDRTRYDLERTRVRAPFAGVVASRSATEGEYLNAGSPLLRLVDTDNLEISVNAPLRVAQHNQSGNMVQVEAGGQQAEARIRGLVPVGDARSRMMELRLALTASPWLIGEAVTVDLPDSAQYTTLRIPRDALVLRDKEVYVYTVGENRTAVKVPVVPVSGRDKLVAVEADLAPGDQVVVRGAERLREGQRLRVIPRGVAVRP